MLILIYMKNVINENRIDQIIQESIDRMIFEMSPRPMKPREVFIQEAKRIHGDKYDYSRVVYQGTDVKVEIGCPVRNHGYFWQRPHHHLEGEGCPLCCESYLERNTEHALIEEGVKYKKQHPIGRQRLDFYLLDYNAAIECQGEQHYQAVWGEERLAKQKEWDRLKKENCAAQNIKLFEIAYWDKKRVSQKVKEIIEILKNGNV